ncbi:Wzz/FepE/Etk N-terminal domain-containing protein [Flavitalea flava]
MTVVSPDPDASRIFDEFSPRRFILLIRKGGRHLLSRWKIILAVAILTSIGGGIYSFFKKPLYSAEITFALDEEATQSPARSGLSVLSEQLGIGPTPDAGGVFSSMTNIVELMQSRLLVEKTLRRSVDVNGHRLILANFFLDSLDFREKWLKEFKGKPYFHQTFLPANSSDPADPADSTNPSNPANPTNPVNPAAQRKMLIENRLLENIYKDLTSRSIKIERKGKGTTILSVICSSEHELFSKKFLETLLDEVTNYYIETKTLRARLNLSLIQKRTDSVRNAYNNALSGRASFGDAHSNPSRQIAYVSRERLQTDIDILRANYIELVKSMESAKTSLMRETPLIQYIDLPVLPLTSKKSDLIRFLGIFFLAGGFLAAGIILLVKAYRHILAN